MTTIKDARNKAGYKQKEVSALTGIPLGTLRRWEQGVNEPPIESIIQLAELYQVSTDELLGSSFAPSEYDVGGLSEDEHRLIELYRKCSEQGCEYILQVASVTAGIFATENEG